MPAPGTSPSYPLVIQIEKTPDPDCLQIFTAVSTFAVAIFAGAIAVRQWKTARAALNYSAFDKRFAVFDATRNFVGQIAIKDEVTSEMLNAFIRGTLGARWLFNDKMAAYLDGLNHKAIEFQGYLLDLRIENPDDDKAAIRAKASMLRKFFNNELKELNGRFKDHMPNIAG